MKLKLEFNEIRALVIVLLRDSDLESEYGNGHPIVTFRSRVWNAVLGNPDGTGLDEVEFEPSTELADGIYEMLHALYYDSRAFGRCGSLVPDGVRTGDDPGDEAYLPVYPGPGTIFDLASKFGQLSEGYAKDNDASTFGKRIRSGV